MAFHGDIGDAPRAQVLGAIPYLPAGIHGFGSFLVQPEPEKVQEALDVARHDAPSLLVALVRREIPRSSASSRWLFPKEARRPAKSAPLMRLPPPRQASLENSLTERSDAFAFLTEDISMRLLDEHTAWPSLV
jgi:hypothetical protein